MTVKNRIMGPCSSLAQNMVNADTYQWRIQDFPWGGVDLVGGGVDSRGGYVSKILYVKTKELGPLGGRAPGAPPPRSANAYFTRH